MSGRERILPVILAGGGGTRLWPLSGGSAPKQFQRLAGSHSTYQQALLRVGNPDLFERPVVLTGTGTIAVAREQAAELGIEVQIIVEPLRRGSAVAMAIAALIAQQRAKGGAVLALASDQVIEDERAFHEAVKLGGLAAREASVVVFGIEPGEPLTSYGYIKAGGVIGAEGDLREVQAFVEKPDQMRAKELVAAGYLWNSGNFLFRAEAMVTLFEKHGPEILAAARQALEGAATADGFLFLEAGGLAWAPETSIDYAVIEKAKNVAVVKCRWGWRDVGNWASYAAASGADASGNAIVGLGMLRESRNCLIHSEGRLTVAVGVEGLAIIATEDAVLVVAKERSEEVKAIVAELEGGKLRKAAKGYDGV